MKNIKTLEVPVFWQVKLQSRLTFNFTFKLTLFTHNLGPVFPVNNIFPSCMIFCRMAPTLVPGLS